MARGRFNDWYGQWRQQGHRGGVQESTTTGGVGYAHTGGVGGVHRPVHPNSSSLPSDYEDVLRDRYGMRNVNDVLRRRKRG